MSKFKKKITPVKKKSAESIWIYSYADLMSLLFCFFVILHSFTRVDDNRIEDIEKKLAAAFKGETKEIKEQSETSKEQSDISKEQLEETFKMLVSQSKFGISEKEIISKVQKIKDKKKILKDTKIALEDEASFSNYIEVGELQDKGFNISLPGSIVFRPGSSQIKKEGRKVINKLSVMIRNFDDLIAVEVIGHTSSIFESSDFRKLSLSAERASRVAGLMIKNGNDRRIFTVRGRGDLEPIFPELSGAGGKGQRKLSLNDRVHIVVRRSE